MFFVTAYLGEAHGSAKSARDFARCLLAHCRDTNIVAPKSECFGGHAVGYALFEPVWHLQERAGGVPPRQSRGRRLLTALRDRLSLTERLSGLAGPGWKKSIGREVVVVNGWASIAYWRSVGVSARRCALIVRESPRHFDCKDRDIPLSRIIAELASFDMLIFVSKILQEEWTQLEELSAKPSFYFPNCCEEEEVERVSVNDCYGVRAGLGLTEKDLMVVCPGTIEGRKGQDIVLRKWQAILDECPNAWLLLLGNGITDFGKGLIRDISAGVFGPRITHLEAQPSAIAYIKAANLLLFPSRAEALPRTVLEAMAAGTPIISSSVDGIPELIEHDRSGWLFNPEDDVSMIAGIAAAVSEPDRAAAWAAEARRRYHELFSRKCQIDRTPELLSWLGVD